MRVVVDEGLEIAAQILLRCSVIGFVMLLYWWGALQVGGDFVYKVHSNVAPSISREHFDIINYAGMILLKLCILLLFLFPYLATRLVIRKRKALDAQSAEGLCKPEDRSPGENG